MTIIAAAALLFLTGCTVPLTQVEMTRQSAEELELAYKECYLIEQRIMDQRGYKEIEKQFRADRELFEEKLKAEWEKFSKYAGGSMEPMDRNERMTDLVRKRMDELKTKWPAKP